MHLVMLDTWVWLDMSSQNVEFPIVTSLQHRKHSAAAPHRTPLAGDTYLPTPDRLQ